MPVVKYNVVKLARIEHARWTIECRINGWRQARNGEKRDNDRKIHTLLVPWDARQMTSEERGKDVTQVLVALEHVTGA